MVLPYGVGPELVGSGPMPAGKAGHKERKGSVMRREDRTIATCPAQAWAVACRGRDIPSFVGDS